MSSSSAVDQTVRYENIPQKFAIHYPNSYIQQEGMSIFSPSKSIIILIQHHSTFNIILTLLYKGFMGSTVSFSLPEPGNSTEFPTNLNVVVQDMGGQSMTLEDFCEMLKQQLEVRSPPHPPSYPSSPSTIDVCDKLQHGQRDRHDDLWWKRT